MKKANTYLECERSLEIGPGMRAGWSSSGLLAGFVALPLLLGACTAVPDWADPTKSFTADEAPTKVGVGKTQYATAESADFPNLASVPNQLPRQLSAAARARISDDLAIDRANAANSGEAQEVRTFAAIQRSETIAAAQGAPQAPAIAQNMGKVAIASATPAAPESAPESMRAAAAPELPVTELPVTAPPESELAVSEPKVEVIAPPLETAAPPVSALARDLRAPAAPDSGSLAEQTQIAQTSEPPAKPQLRFPQFDKAPDAAAPDMANQSAGGRSELAAIIYFAHASVAVDAKDRRVLRDIVALHRARGGIIRIIGHASARTKTLDQVKHRVTNLGVSLKRANAVAAELYALGVEKDKVRAEAEGDGQPVYHEFMPTGEAGNRRAEVFLEY